MIKYILNGKTINVKPEHEEHFLKNNPSAKKETSWLKGEEGFIPDELEFWIQQFKCRHFLGNSEWSEKWQKNIWVPDEPEDMTEEPFKYVIHHMINIINIIIE